MGRRKRRAKARARAALTRHAAEVAALTKALWEARDAVMGYASIAIMSGELDAEDCADLAEYLRDQPDGHGASVLREQVPDEILEEWATWAAFPPGTH